MTTNQLLGRVVALQYRNVAAQPGGHPTMPVLRVYIRTPMRTVEHHDLPNGNYVVQNPALQFLALHGYKPSDIDGTHMNIEADKVILPIAPMPQDEYREHVSGSDTDSRPRRVNSWGLAQDAMSGGEQALREAEWFDGGDIGDAEQTPQHGAGGSPDPGTGNRGGVEEPSDPEPKVGVADDDSDAGFEVTVE